MTAALTWLDHDAADRDRMNRILALFRERETRDELGVGVIRDLLADELFPGTSTIWLSGAPVQGTDHQRSNEMEMMELLRFPRFVVVVLRLHDRFSANLLVWALHE